MPELSVILKGKLDELEDTLKEAQKLLEDTGDTADDTNKKISNSGKDSAKGIKIGTDALKNLGEEVVDVAAGSTKLTTGLKNVAVILGGSAGVGAVAGIVANLLIDLALAYLKVESSTERVAKATASYLSEANKEIDVLRNLISLVEDVNLSNKIREGALDRINDKYSKYLGFLDLEKIKVTDVKESIDALTKSLIAQAQVRGIESAIAQVYEDAGEEITTLLLRQRAAAKAVKAEVDELLSLDAFSRIDRTLPLTKQIEQIQNIVNRNQGAGAGLLAGLGISVANFNEAVANTREFRQELQGELGPLQELLRDFTANDLFKELFELEGVTVTPAKEKIQKLKNNFRDLDEIFAINDSAQRFLEESSQQFGRIEFEYDQFGNRIVKALDIAPRIKPQLSNIEQALLDFNENSALIIQDSITSTFAGIGQAIGQALGEGENLGAALAKSLLSSIGSVLIQLGELAIATGVGLLGIKTALKTLNPAVAIAAGAALIAIGSAVSSGAANIGGQIGGGGSNAVAGQGSSTASFSGGIASGVSTSSGGQVVFRIRGRDLIGVIDNERAASTRLGG